MRTGSVVDRGGDGRTTSRIGQAEQWRGMYKDCQRQKSVEIVDTSNGCRPSVTKRTREEEEEEEDEDEDEEEAAH